MAPSKRPLSITLLCILSAVGAIIGIPILLYGGMFSSMPSWYLPYLVLTTIVGLAAAYGMWQMKKWSVKLYTGMAVVSQIVLLVMGNWGILSVVIPGFVIWILYSNYDKMT